MAELQYKVVIGLEIHVQLLRLCAWLRRTGQQQGLPGMSRYARCSAGDE